MAKSKKGKRKQPGTLEKRTVMQLQPVKYQVELYYMGHERVTRNATTYRCRYVVSSLGDMNALMPGTLLPNVVRKSNNDPKARLAAKPRDNGGTPEDVPAGQDKRYRIIVTDNHGTRTAENLTLLGSDGDTESNPKYYVDRNWLPDVKPIVPLRVVVKRFVGGKQVSVSSKKTPKVVFEVKDPVEEFAQNDGRRRTFTEDFFKKYNRTDSNPSVGDDNGLTWFNGGRPPSAGQSGVKAVDVLKKAPYKDKPIVGGAYAQTNVLADTDHSAAAAEGAMNAKFDLTLVKDPAKKCKVGVADLGFCPPPIGGDNYRFLLTLYQGSKDIRKTKEKGKRVELVDDANQRILKKRWYTGPRLTFWRKIEFRLLVRANRTVDADLRWNEITAMYRKAFVEVVKPELSVELTRAEWIQLLKATFGNSAKFLQFWHFTEAKYAARLFPSNLTSGVSNNDLHDKIELYARKAISLACTQNGGIPDPDVGDNKLKQNDGNGMYMFLSRDPFDDAALGAYFGDRCFWMQKPTGADGDRWATSTCAHEFGHVRSLRHAHTSDDRFRFKPAAGAIYSLYLVNPRSNNAPLDHDALDAYACLMGYTRPLDAEPCGMCALSMRFYDRVEIQKDTRFRNQIIDRMWPVDIGIIRTDATGEYLEIVSGTTVNLAAATSEKAKFMAVGPETAYTTRSGSARKGRVNLTTINKDESWSLTNMGTAVGATFKNSGAWSALVEVEAKAAGASTVTFKQGAHSVTVTVNVT